MRQLALAALVLTACAQPPSPAPEHLDANLRWWWVNGDALTDAELIDGASKLAVAGEAETRVKALKGQLGRLAKEDLKVVGLEDSNDPSTARGMVMLNAFACSLDKLTAILVNPDQSALYPGVYDVYERTYTSDLGRFTEGTATTVGWDTNMKATYPIGDQYSALVHGRLRRVSASADDATNGPMLISRVWLPSPGVFADKNSASYFKQDYQLELFWERAPGQVFHAYAMWRESKVGSVGWTTDDNNLMPLLLDKLVEWDDNTVKLCAKQ